MEKAERLTKTTITLARDLWEGAKIEALKSGLTLTEVVQAALRRYLEVAERERKKRE